ncbi:hypothetical protein AMAG_04707 [Allomyces macrogynus ATCC 38327]|uniref:F-box domain-containing protein n=1 Tax=Allomyces macrogynus (strain ATCC 38327) TaxID=578462 RepID=A0A0L0S5T2_ALLM3|nr:hypothetical protein AMAG_04707 [Allomyces macrogynus ATCC 38327]|eukprot:KNE57862.1 hypothetical protein AMAG_04707 [Allomyces macrogynus ATCC 38327]
MDFAFVDNRRISSATLVTLCAVFGANLRRLTLSGTCIKDEDLAKIFPRVPALETLSVAECTSITGHAFTLVQNPLALRVLDLRDCSMFSTTAAAAMSIRCPQLEHLDLRGNRQLSPLCYHPLARLAHLPAGLSPIRPNSCLPAFFLTFSWPSSNLDHAQRSMAIIYRHYSRSRTRRSKTCVFRALPTHPWQRCSCSRVT